MSEELRLPITNTIIRHPGVPGPRFVGEPTPITESGVQPTDDLRHSAEGYDTPQDYLQGFADPFARRSPNYLYDRSVSHPVDDAPHSAARPDGRPAQHRGPGSYAPPGLLPGPSVPDLRILDESGQECIAPTPLDVLLEYSRRGGLECLCDPFCRVSASVTVDPETLAPAITLTKRPLTEQELQEKIERLQRSIRSQVGLPVTTVGEFVDNVLRGTE